MKINKKMLVYSVGLAFLLNASCMMAEPRVQVLAGSSRLPISPQMRMVSMQADQLDKEAAIALHAGRYAEAESDIRQSIALWPIGSGVSDEILARSLEAQGRDQEALQICKKIVVDRRGSQLRDLIPYSWLLLKSGQWAEAVTVYNQAIPMLGQEELERDSSHFSLDVPNPTALAVAIHLERGRIYSTNCDWAGETQDTEAMVEYGKALQLAPNYGLANYYYGQGWQKLSPAERKQFGTAQQAKAALQKAVKLGKGDVKLAAAKALKSFS